MSLFERRQANANADELSVRLNRIIGPTPDDAPEPAYSPPMAAPLPAWSSPDAPPAKTLEDRLAGRLLEEQPEAWGYEPSHLPDGSDPSPAATTGPGAAAFFPPIPHTTEETGLSSAFVTDLILRVVYQANELTGGAVAERVALPFGEVVAPILEGLRREQAFEVKGQRGLSDAGYIYALTDKGLLRAREATGRTTYTGPAPVPLVDYNEAVLAQHGQKEDVTAEVLKNALHDMVLDERVLDQIGPAVNADSSIFLFGAPGNGKTSLAEHITALLGDPIYVPYAVEVDGEVIKLFDPLNHRPVDGPGPSGQLRRVDWDARWVKIERPVVVAGGELTLGSLELIYHEAGRYYEAPLQMKANGGMFLIDDFGRQAIRPQDLLNRWIVPLEKRIDYLTMATGSKIAIPFEQLIVFSTNLDPQDLVDEAFLRRIKFKISIADPSEREFREIFRGVCRSRGVAFDEGMFDYMLGTHYRPMQRPLRMCQPRDLIDQIIAIAKYKAVPAELTRNLIDCACTSYFV